MSFFIPFFIRGSEWRGISVGCSAPTATATTAAAVSVSGVSGSACCRGSLIMSCLC